MELFEPFETFGSSSILSRKDFFGLFFGVFRALWPFWAYQAFWVILITLDLIGPLRLFGLLGTLSESLNLFATLQDILGLFGLFWPLVISGLWLNWIILFLILGLLDLFGPYAFLSFGSCPILGLLWPFGFFAIVGLLGHFGL